MKGRIKKYASFFAFAMLAAVLAGCTGRSGDVQENVATGALIEPGQNEGQTGTAAPEPTKAPTATPEPTPAPVPEGKTYADGYKSPVAGEKDDFDAKALEADGFTVVSTTEDFLAAIHPGAGIIIAPGYYDMSLYMEEAWQKGMDDFANFDEVERELRVNDWVYIVECFDGVELEIRGADDLMISGGSEAFGDTELVVEPRYAEVMRFECCRNVDLFNLTMGHTESGDCSGNVIDIERSNNIRMHNMDIFGCGVYGLGICKGSGDISLYESTIRDCRYGPLLFQEGIGIVAFYNCTLNGSAGSMPYWATTQSRLVFDHCILGDWETTAVSFDDEIELVDCKLGNILSYPEYDEDRFGEEDENSFDPAGFSSEAMVEAYDEPDVLSQYNEWIGYRLSNMSLSKVRYMPYYDTDRDQYMSAAVRLESYEGENTGWISIGDRYYECTWYYFSPDGIVIEPVYYEGDKRLSEEEDGNIYAVFYRDKYTGHGWMNLWLDQDSLWLYGYNDPDYAEPENPEDGLSDESRIRNLVDDMSWFEQYALFDGGSEEDNAKNLPGRA